MDDVIHLPDNPGQPAPSQLHHNGSGIRLAKPSARRDFPAYAFVDDPKTVAYLLEEHEYLTHVSGDRLEDLLGGSAPDVIEAIGAGEVDDILNVVLWVERQHDNRVTVLRAIAERSDDLAAKQAQEDVENDAVDPSDITTSA